MDEQAIGSRTKNILGCRFGRLIVMSYAGKSKYGYALWNCICDCGVLKVIPGCSLTTNLAQSCGCLRQEVTGNKRRTHGKSLTRTHNIWMGMIKRCFDPNVKRWDRYGGRGIRVCGRWHKFENFLADMGECPDDFTLERKDNNGNYEPCNCEWASRLRQARNSTQTHLVEFQGKTLCLTEWAELTGIDPTALRYRLKVGWDIEKALTTPSRGKFWIRRK